MDIYLDKKESLTPMAKRIILNKATEYPFSGQYNEPLAQGTYLCRRCGLALFRAHNQFHSGCGWPSFDESLAHQVEQIPDPDGQRMEIVCVRCKGHLGHIFMGESYTSKNTRYCVNGASIDFVPNDTVLDTEEAIVAGGCFWGIDHFLRQLPGVLNVEVGYTGGHYETPSYEEVCQNITGHYEAARVIYDRQKIDYRTILKRFFEIHDPSKRNSQGGELPQQYQSAVFYFNPSQLIIIEELIARLRNRGYNVITKCIPIGPFWPAEAYHQNYFTKHTHAPICHQPEARFGDDLSQEQT